MPDKAVIDNLWIRASDIGLKLLGALAIWIIGRALIKFGLNLIVARLEKRKVDHTIVGYVRNTISVALNIVLAVVLMGELGIETTSFAAFIAGAGLAIGAAWSGLLSNFAAGAFLVVLRPFKAGDYVTAGGVTGTVVEVGLFVTTITGPDNVRTFVGNSKILADNLKNYSANTSRRVELTGNVSSSPNLDHTVAAIRERLSKVANVLADPEPEVKLLSFNEEGCLFAIRPYTHNDNYWQVYHDSTAALRGLVDSVGVPAAGPADEHSGAEMPEGEEPEEEEAAAGAEEAE